MDYKALTVEHLSKHGSDVSQKNALVGFDGFIDRITSVVDKRYGQGDQFERMDTIEVFGNRVLAAAGQSANIELFVNFEKLGGNGPIMANALLNAGVNTRYIGALGDKTIRPVFEEFAKNTGAISIVNPGITHALEFTDGKIMLGTMSSLDEISYDSILKHISEGEFFDLLSRQDLISMVNWTMIPNMTQLFVDLLDKVIPNLPPRDIKHYYFDLADPEKRPANEIEEVLRTISRFQNHGQVTLGLNLAEAKQVYGILGQSEIEADAQGLKTMASSIRNELNLGCVVVHPKESAACATKEDTFWIPGPYTDKPKITTGAGDHFNAGFSTAQLLGFPPLVCLTIGVCFSGHYVRTGESPSLEDIKNFIQNWKDV
ncbi:MAG: carbohydrate kinase family protein [Verrucomicrobia bacterium]|nr:carbohydrate kinase family protein [Verrucomicrobiota bacterium]MDA1066955.1 carbohydrate kinase family protein [Verrucomicrobiota bacterium]